MKKYVQLKDIGKVITGKTPPTCDERNFNGDFPFITPTDIKSFDEKLITETERTISNVGYKKLKNILLPKDSICFVCIGSTIGKMCFTVKESFTNQQINSLIVNHNYNAEYVFYLLRYIKNYFQQIGDSAGSGKGIVNKTTFEKSKILVEADIIYQRKIASILSTYDKLIENNNKRIKILEQMAENLYKEWFVRFRFPGYETTEFENGIPKGWEKVFLGEVLLNHFNGGWGLDNAKGNKTNKGFVIRGTDIWNIKSANLSEIPCRYHSLSEIHNKQLEIGDIIIELSNGNINNVGRSLYVSEYILNKFDYLMCASFCKTLRPKNSRYGKAINFMVIYLQKSNLLSFYKNTGTNGINNFNFKRFLRQEVIVPSEYLLDKIQDIYNLVDKYRDEIINLKKQRDLLLPRLMNGILEVIMENKESIKTHKFDYINKEWANRQYDENNFAVAARKDGTVSEESISKLKAIAEEDDE